MQNSVHRIISQKDMPGVSILTQNVKKMLHPSGVDCSSTFSWTFIGWGKILPNSQKFAHTPHQENPP